MFRNISYTVFFRAVNILFSFLAVLLVSRYLGAEGKGIVSLIILDVSLIQLISDYIGGTPLVYMTPRQSLPRLLIPAYLWAFISTSILIPVLNFTGSLPEGLFLHVLILSMLNALLTTHLMVLLGREEILLFNILNFIKTALLTLLLVAGFLLLENRTIQVYIFSFYCALGMAFIISFWHLVIRNKDWNARGWLSTALVTFRYGLFGQTANVLQFLNYRFSYFLLERITGIAQLGIYSNAIHISEALLLLSRGIGTVLYARVANTGDFNEAAKLTLRISRITLLLTLIISAPLFFLPPAFYRWIFGPEFGDVSIAIVILLPGILVLSMTSMFNQFFGGSGKYWVNALSSGAGLLVTVAGCYLLIPGYGIKGAAIASLLSNLISGIVTILAFIKMTHRKWRELIPETGDIHIILEKLKGLK